MQFHMKKKKSGCSSPVCTVLPLGASVSLSECFYFYMVWVIFPSSGYFSFNNKASSLNYFLFICSFIFLLPTCVCKVSSLIDVLNCS